MLSALAVTAVLAAPALSACTVSPAAAPVVGAVATPRPDADHTRVEGLTQLLQSRFLAVEHGDRTAWLAALSPEVRSADRAAQGRTFDRMRAMGVGDLQVVSVVESPGTATASPAVTTTSPGVTTTSAAAAPEITSGEWRATVTASYRLTGYDSAPRTFAVDLTVGGASDPTATPAGDATPRIRTWVPAERPQPWDLEGLRVRRSPDALLLVVGSEARLAELARRAQEAAGRVASVWGKAEPSVWIAPDSDDDAARLLGRATAGISGLAAVTDGPLETGEPAGADRIVVVPSAWGRLSGNGRDVVLTHELTHATVRASTTRAVPSWLAEGFADFVAFGPIRLPEREVVAPALDLVRSHGLPEALPADTDFYPAAGRVEAAYGLSLLAVRTLAERHGTAALVRLYRDAAGALSVPTASLGDAEATTDLALEQLGTDRATLVTQWRARITSLLAR